MKIIFNYLLLTLMTIGYVCAVNAPPSQSFVVPKPDNGFTADFGKQDPGATMIVIVTATPGCTITAKVTGGDSKWLGGPTFTGTIPGDWSGRHTGKFGGTYSCGGSGEGEGEIPTWNGGAVASTDCNLYRIELHVPMSEIRHGDIWPYSAKGFDASGKDITDKVSWTWVHNIVEHGKVTIYTADLGDDDVKSKKECKEQAIRRVYLIGSCGDVTITEYDTFDVNKGKLVKSYPSYEITKDVVGAYREEAISEPLVIEKSANPRPPEATETMTTSNVVTASTEVSGSAEASVAPFGVGTKLTIGISGTDEVSEIVTTSKSYKVYGMNTCDVRFVVIRRVADRQTEWVAYQFKTYDTGYTEKCEDGRGLAQTEKAEVRLRETLENCDQ